MPDLFCPACGAVVNSRCVFGPDDADDILAFRPFYCTCGSRVPFPCVYAQDGAVVRLTLPGFPAVPFDPPPAAHVLRETTHLLPFREKVLLLTAGYDDRYVELVKLIARGANEEIEDCVASAANDEFIEFRAIRRDGSPVIFRSPRELYENVRHEVPDEILRTDGLTVVDAAWAGKHVSLAEVPPQEK